MAAFRGMHVSPAKHSYAWLPLENVTTERTHRQTDGRTDRQTPDKVIPMYRYASQATLKSFEEIIILKLKCSKSSLLKSGLNKKFVKEGVPPRPTWDCPRSWTDLAGKQSFVRGYYYFFPTNFRQYLQSDYGEEVVYVKISCKDGRRSVSHQNGTLEHSV